MAPTLGDLDGQFLAFEAKPVPLKGQARAEEWLLVEWPEGETEPTKYWFSTLPEDIAFDRLVDLTKLRWRIERDYQSSNRNSALVIMKGAGGAASTITPHSASPPTAS